MSCGGTERGWLRRSIGGKQTNSDRLLRRRVIHQLLLRININKNIAEFASYVNSALAFSHKKLQKIELLVEARHV